MNRSSARWTSLLAAACGLAVLAACPASAQAPAAKAKAETAREIVGMRRLTEGEYRRSIADVFGADIKVQGRFEPVATLRAVLTSALSSPASSGRR